MLLHRTVPPITVVAEPLITEKEKVVRIPPDEGEEVDILLSAPF